MTFLSLDVLEELVPELSILANSPKTSQQQVANFSTLIKTATLRWLIAKSLYDQECDYFVELESEWFDCATWMNKLCQKIPDAKNKTIEFYLFSEYTLIYKDRWIKSILNRYKIDFEILNTILSRPLFNITSKSLRNNFQRLCQSDPPKLIKSGDLRGKYKKRLNYLLPENYKNDLKNNVYPALNDDFWDFLNEGVSAIAQMLFMKINGHQRLVLHSDYILEEETQELAEDWAEQLRINWQSKLIMPIKLRYYSASKNSTNNYYIYPVCLQYYQRAYYLSAVGDSPVQRMDSKPNWYNYRLDRVLDIEELNWEHCDRLQLLKNQIYEHNSICYQYTSGFIQEQLDEAYGFDFYRQSETLLLKFDRDYDQKYLQNTVRHKSFQKINSIQELQTIFNHQQDMVASEIKKKIIDNFSKYSYYKFNYRIGDYHVVLRLLSWRNSVEVLLPSHLRQKIVNEIEMMSQMYLDS